MASSQKPSDRKDNKRSTPTSNIPVGEPVWNKKAHDQDRFDQGYDWGDPVSFLRGNTTKEGGYSSGNAIDRFGEFSLTQSVYNVKHGEIIEFVITRKGGDMGEFEFTIKKDTEPFVGRPDPNTGFIGNYRTSVQDGFYKCDVDLDLYSLMQDRDDVVWDDVTSTLYIYFKDKEAEKRLYFLVPYRTQIQGMLPDVLERDFTYQVDEYELLDIRNMDDADRPDVKMIGSPVDCQHGRVTPTDTTLNRKLGYKVYSLPVPQFFTEQQGENPAEIDSYNGVLFNRYPFTSREYTCGLTRSVEGSLISIGDTTTATDEVTACLSGVPESYGKFGQDADNFAHNTIYNKLSADNNGILLLPFTDVLGMKEPLSETTQQAIDNNLLIPVSAFEFGYKFKTGLDDPESAHYKRFTQYESYKVTTGQTPEQLDIVTLYRNAPGGVSDFVSLEIPQDHVQQTGDLATTIGNIKHVMFTNVGVDPTKINPITHYMKYEDAAHRTDLSFPQRLGTSLVQTFSGSLVNEISGFAGAWNIGTDVNSEIGATDLIDSWTEHDISKTKRIGAGESGTSNILYNLSALTHDYEDMWKLNDLNLRAYYMTCFDHQSKKIYLEFDSTQDDPVMQFDVTRCVINIDKTEPYDVRKHAIYDDTVYPSRQMKHGEGLSASYVTGQDYAEPPRGENLLYRLFKPLVPLTQTTTPAFTGYSGFGAISGDDICFVSFQAGSIPGDPDELGGNPGLVGPMLKTINPSDDDLHPNATVGDVYSTYALYQNTGDMPMWMDFQFIGESRSGTNGTWVLGVSAAATTAEQRSMQTYRVGPGEQVAVTYQTTITQAQIDAGGDRYDHVWMQDTGSKLPGIVFNTTPINISITT